MRPVFLYAFQHSFYGTVRNTERESKAQSCVAFIWRKWLIIPDQTDLKIANLNSRTGHFHRGRNGFGHSKTQLRAIQGSAVHNNISVVEEFCIQSARWHVKPLCFWSVPHFHTQSEPAWSYATHCPDRDRWLVIWSAISWSDPVEIKCDIICQASCK